MENLGIILLLAAIAGSVIWYLVRAKKRGQSCICCPYAKDCGSKCGSCSGTKN